MARREVIEITCDRCSKTETQPKSSEPIQTPELRITFHGVTTEYGDLCVRCRSAVENYFKSMTKRNDEEEKAQGKPDEPAKTGFFGGKKG
jgi:hypothetical protein